MTQRIVIITGCSTGIGLSVAVLLARDAEKKFKVYATMRNLAKKDELVKKGGDCVDKTLFVLQMDVCSEPSVLSAIKEVFDKEGRVDALINNAGIGLAGALEHQSMETIANLYETNVHGVIRTIRAVLPSMKKQKSGHIINVSSVAGLSGVPFNAVYSSSKFAIEGLSESLAPELAQFNINVSVIEPGPVSTEFATTTKAEGFSGVTEGDNTTKELLNKTIAQLMASLKAPGVSQTPVDVAEIILTALGSENPHLRYVTNTVFVEALKKKYIDLSGDAAVKDASQRFFSSGK